MTFCLKTAGVTKMQCKDGEHKWVIEDYCADERDGVMRGPVCSECGAIGEYVMGWQQATALTVTDERNKLEEFEHRIMSEKFDPKKRDEILKILQSADDSLTDAQKIARDNKIKRLL